jgi:type I restriction-modification system DNA methylase subunit
MNQEALKQILSNKYDRAEWQKVLREVFGAKDKLRQQPRDITAALTGDGDRKIADAAWELGSFDTSDDRKVGLYQIDLTDQPQIWRNRVGLRNLLKRVYSNDVDAALVAFKQKDKWRLSLISEIKSVDNETGEVVELKTEPKRYTYLLGKGETVRTPVERLHDLQTSDRKIETLITAFSVEALNKDFFREYKVVFDALVNEAGLKVPDKETARLFAQRLLNRLMFLYFIQKKDWMTFDGDSNYLRTIFDEAVRRNQQFYSDRLYYVFFYGLSNHAESKEIHNQKELEAIRGTVPYLNGGLFEPEKDGLDEKGKVPISNEIFEEILRLFERYNFTIDESTPFEVQVAVDPEMLGKVFEELVTGRHESGSYYTPRTVVSFMCREALKHALEGIETPEVIAKLVDENDGKPVKNPEKILERLRALKVCDPACGSGAYLLGMLQELLHVREALFAATDIAKDAQYKWKREIIEHNIYGVDLDRFATQIAALRLWLSLAIESEEPKPLPNLKYKIGCGDSLLSQLETVGQRNLHRAALIEQFKARKKEYTDADNHLEKAAAEAEIERLRVEIAQMFHHLPEPPEPADIILAEQGVQPLKEKVDRLVKLGDKGQAEKFQKQLDRLLSRINELKSAVGIQHYDTGTVFDWSVEFADVFEDGGFDIVLANPPYVRQEDIKPKEYKAKLLSLYSEAMSGKSDLFVAFYARGLQLLKDGGTHVFVCSNSWLDVGYGGKLQGYLLNNSHVAAIYDSAIERQFASADINTIISFIHKQEPDDEDITQFVSFRAPFLEALADETKRRVVKKTSAEIWESGSNENNRYEGDKWGGKYLRAPDIYFTILEKGKGKLVRLGDIADVRRGITTGANEFFYLSEEDQQKWRIEEEFLKPVIKSPRECRSIVVKPEDLKFKLFYCHKDKRDLRGTNALRYIEWGETDDEWLDDDGNPNPPYLRPSCRGRHNWYDLGNREKPRLNINYLVNEVMRTFIKEDGFYVSDNFQEIHSSPEKVFQIGAGTNSTLFQLFANVTGRANFGEGLMKIQTYEVKALPIVNPKFLSAKLCEQRLENVAMLNLDSDDRRELDDLIFDALGLTAGERDAVYDAVIDLVSKRLQRAQTVTV